MTTAATQRDFRPWIHWRLQVCQLSAVHKATLLRQEGTLDVLRFFAARQGLAAGNSISNITNKVCARGVIDQYARRVQCWA